MPIDPLTAALVGGSALGGAFSGASQAGASKAGVKEQKREFDISSAPGTIKFLQSMPLRDRLMYLLQQRFGVNPTTWSQAQAGYKPGAGGVDLPYAHGVALDML